jgi:formate dehydrogenase major subunit
MDVTRREFLAVSGVVGAGIALSTLGVDMGPAKAYADQAKVKQLKRSKQSTSICPYCAVGCGILVSTMNPPKGPVVNTEGSPDNLINQGTLCSKGTALIQMGFVNGEPNEKRMTKPLYRGKGESKWKEISWEKAIDMIASKIKETRDANWIEEDEILDKNGKPTGKKVPCNRTEAIACLGGAAYDNEECYLLVKMARALGLVYLEHQARI